MSDKKKSNKRNWLIAIGFFFALILLGEILSRIPGAGILAVVGVLVLWTVVGIGAVWKDGPAWISKTKERFSRNTKLSVTVSCLFLFAGIAADGIQDSRELRAEEEALAQEQAALRVEAARQDAKERDTQLVEKFRNEKDNLWERIQAAGKLISDGQLEEAVTAIAELNDEVLEYENSSVVQDLDYDRFPKAIGDLRLALGDLLAEKKPFEKDLRQIDRLIKRRRISDAIAKADEIQDAIESYLQWARGPEVQRLRRIMDEKKGQIYNFEMTVFNDYFKLLWAPENADVNEDRLTRQVARKYGLTMDEVSDIYLRYQEKVEARLREE